MEVASEEEPLLDALRHAGEPSSALDVRVGAALGYLPVDGTLDGNWRDPIGRVGPLPAFTGDLDALVEVILDTFNETGFGIAWEPGAASAKIGSNRYFVAATPALSLAIALVAARTT